jgi:hypothetical protein
VRKNNQTYERQAADLLARHKDEYAVVGEGRILGTFVRPKDAYALVRQAGLAHAIVTRIEEERPRKKVELGWGVMEQLV